MASLTPEQALDVIERVSGHQPGYRRGHARGLVLRGTFQATPEARTFTVAEHFQGGAVPVLVRVSNASANVCAADRMSDKEGRVMGLAVRFDLPSGAHPAWAAINIPAFPARTPEEFVRLTAAQAPGAGGKPNMLRLLWHIVRHLHILASIKAIKGMRPTGSLAGETFRGIHTYYFQDGRGARQAFRYEWIPRQEHVALDVAAAKAKPKLYLLDEIRARLAAGELAWDLEAVFPATGDSLDDPSVAWPADRPRAKVGRLTVNKVHEDQRAVEDLVFDPGQVVPGLALSDDPILKFRSRVYGESFARRSREHRREPAPADMAQDPKP
jgi:catalase